MLTLAGKTWTGVPQGVPPNGGGGGLGFAKNISTLLFSSISLLVSVALSAFRNFTLKDISIVPVYMTQCISFQGSTGQCDTSHFQLSNITWEGMTGNTLGSQLASLQCSGATPCPGIAIVDFHVTTGSKSNHTYQCSNIVHPIGFTCS
jgi:galacturan 1,4-alpha-galacturonidase